MPIAGLILAAGGSSRMKATKQLLPWGKHRLLQHVIQTAGQSELDALYLVLGSASEAIRRELDLENLIVIENDRWQEGLGSSIAAGVEAISSSTSYEACLILLGDQPFVSSDYLNKMLAHYHPDIITASDYGGKAGVPCIFPKRFFPDLQRLQGDHGAKTLLNTLNKHVRFPKSTADLRDIDTPETYRKYLPK